MLALNMSRFQETVMRPLHSSVASVIEGVPMVVAMENGTAKVLPSLGNSTTEVFAGVSRSQAQTPTTAPKVEDIDVPAVANGVATTSVTLAKTPINGITILKLTLNEDKTAIVSKTVFTLDGAPTNGVPAAGKYLISGRTVTFNPADASSANDLISYRMFYRFAISAIEAGMLFGTGILDGAQSVVGGTDCVTKADVLFTDQYDPTDDWVEGGPIYLGAGVFTTKSSGKTKLTNAYIVQAPNVAAGAAGYNGFLGISFGMN